jgi:hypothetical protein
MRERDRISNEGLVCRDDASKKLDFTSITDVASMLSYCPSVNLP